MKKTLFLIAISLLSSIVFAQNTILSESELKTQLGSILTEGNDHLFIADKKGKIKKWQKFHSRIIPGHTTFEENKATSLIHSHLKTNPLITATNICSFMLYAPLYDIDTFSVYSPALGKYMTYSLKDNKITVKESLKEK